MSTMGNYAGTESEEAIAASSANNGKYGGIGELEVENLTIKESMKSTSPLDISSSSTINVNLTIPESSSPSAVSESGKMVSFKLFTHTHLLLGALTGRLVENDKVVHFRSIPYATVPARFRPSIPLDHIPENYDDRPFRNFTEYGFGCPGRPHDATKLPGEKPIRYDEFACLGATISASASRLKKISEGKKVDKVPVLVYIHGGAFTEGAGHVSAHHETIRLAELGLKENQEVVLVSIGYRLGAFASVVSQDLLDEAQENGDTEIFNQGLFDQRKALQWIQKNIGGFGGDKDRVTVFGESAGALSIAYHLLADIPLFQRAVLQSGSTTTVPETLTFSEGETVYQNLLGNIGITGATREDRLQALRDVPADQLWLPWVIIGQALTPPFFFQPGTFFNKTEEIPAYHNHAILTAKRDWLEAAIVGDDFFEGYVSYSTMVDAKHLKFLAVMKDVFGEQTARQILNLYSISADEDSDMDQVAFYMRSMYLIGDLWFQEPTNQMTKTLSRAYANKKGGKKQKVFRYEFNLPNPFPGTPYSYVHGHHFVEIFYQFMTFRERYPTQRNNFYARQSEEMARLWIKFANGKDPWPEYNEQTGGKIAICDEINGWHTRTKSEDVARTKNEIWGVRRYEAWDLLGKSFDKIHREGGAAAVESARKRLNDWQSFI